MYVNTSGSPIRERVQIGPWTTLGAAPAPAAKRLPVRRGQRGGLVFTIQRTLNNWVAKWRLPLEALNEDGVYGSATAERVRAFQRALELKADGIVGPSTARWLDQVVGVPLALGSIAAPEAWAHRHAQCLDLKTAGLRSAAAAVLGDAALTGLTMDRLALDPRLHAVLQQLNAPLGEAGLLTPKMQDEVAVAVRAAKPLTAWVALDVVLRLSARSMRCAADLEWPPRPGTS
jgi:peptidoglycan hydrolase-like protein with peptidoglycan-binding domain